MYTESKSLTPIIDIGEYCGNNLWIKREDLIPFSFGGNKARKALLFFQEIDKGDYDSVVTYGSGSSNHCRIIANECSRRGLKCYIISPLEKSDITYNSRMMEMFGAEITVVPVKEVHDSIENKLVSLRLNGKKPYFIEGGGHGNIGTEAYVRCYDEIVNQEKQNGIEYDYIFFASGTGTTQAGLICGNLIHQNSKKIIGISIARKNPRGRDVVLNSVLSYMGNSISARTADEATFFLDEYTNGYDDKNIYVDNIISEVMIRYGIPLDPIYTGKAFWGMSEYLRENGIVGKNVLFLHTGGTPLYFDWLLNRNKEETD